ncbi:MAG: hypothetical protein KAX49_20055, partial [Halanaerobiales bacterium]|nr:hypothetical protein [Halanaerobiales bacterium]
MTKNDNEFTFKDQVKGISGVLEIVQDNTIPMHLVFVGIGMSGAGTFVKQARPNMSYIFTPQPKYWIIFGDIEQGEVLDMNLICDKHPVAQITQCNYPAQLDFPPGRDRNWAR